MLFLREYGVQIHFDFAKYTRKSLTHSIMRGIEITPASWAFMLVCLLAMGGVDLAQHVELVDNDAADADAAAAAGTRRQLAGGGGGHGGLDAGVAVVHVVVVAGVSWLGVAVQVFILVVLRRRQRLLIQRKLHMHGNTQHVNFTLI